MDNFVGIDLHSNNSYISIIDNYNAVMEIAWLAVLPMPWAIIGWTFWATKREIDKSIGHGMELKVFWGIIICQGLQTVKFW